MPKTPLTGLLCPPESQLAVDSNPKPYSNQAVNLDLGSWCDANLWTSTGYSWGPPDSVELNERQTSAMSAPVPCCDRRSHSSKLAGDSRIGPESFECARHGDIPTTPTCRKRITHERMVNNRVPCDLGQRTRLPRAPCS